MIESMRIFAVTIDSPDPRRLARFYRDLLGGATAATNDDFVALTLGTGLRLDFQRVAQYRPPTWPESDTPAQMHLDFVVHDLDEGERRATAHGAVKAGHQPGGDRFRVFLDPDGHPFCLATPATSMVG
jgi:catechol 2,3-dioxygenase-like lactoylglutathione lyase family enzyme